MSAKPRFVLDTNLVVSAVLLPRSVPRTAFDRAFAIGDVLVSDATLDELDDVLRRPRFDRYADEHKRLEFLAAYVRATIRVKITQAVDVCRDAKDNTFLELAVSGHAAAIISGDEDLLILHPFRDISIISAQDYVSQF